MKFQKAVNDLMQDFLNNTSKLRNVRYVAFTIPQSLDKVAVEISQEEIKYYALETHLVYEDITTYDILVKLEGGKLSQVLNKYKREYEKIQDYMKGFNIHKITFFGIVNENVFSITGAKVKVYDIEKNMPPQWFTLVAMQLNFMAENPKYNLHFTNILKIFDNFDEALSYHYDTPDVYIEPYDTFSSRGDDFFRIKVS